MSPRRVPGVCAVALLALAGCVTPQLLEATASDRRAIVTIGDFAHWLEASDLELDPELDSLIKQKLAWSYQLTYDFRGTARDAGEALSVVLHSEVGVHPNAVSALHNFNTYALGLKAGLRRGGATLVDVEPSLDWGEGRELFSIEKDGRQIGNGFIAHAGPVVTYVVVSGLYSSDSALFERALLPRLRELEAYDPASEAPATH